MNWLHIKPSFAASHIAAVITIGIAFAAATQAQQQAPAIGYMYPSGGQAGTTVDVVLGGYDWTPDIEVFVHEPQIRLELTGSLGRVIVPEPPYWFGKKARRPPFLMPRETPAKLSIPADAKPGVYKWQVANANGASATGRFIVSNQPEVLEYQAGDQPQDLDSLPVIVSGRIKTIEEVDRYRFVAPRDGPMTLALSAAAIDSPLTAAIEVRDATGNLIADAVDTSGRDLRVTFAAQRGETYTTSIYDVDFRGNRSFVYRLSVRPGPHIAAVIPAAGTRGETRDVEVVGYGVATGSPQLESITRSITFPATADSSFTTRIETPFGVTDPVTLLIGDGPELVEPAARDGEQTWLAVPSAVTGVLDQRFGTDRYCVAGKKGEVWAIDLQAEAIGSTLDVALSVHDGAGKELKRIDDLPGTTDASLEFAVPADGTYSIAVTDSSGNSGHRDSTYRLAVRKAAPGFILSGPELVSVPIGGKSQLAIKAIRIGGYKEPIAIRIEGLPDGTDIPAETVVPAGKSDIKIELAVADDAGTVAAMLLVSGTANIGGTDFTSRLDPILLATTMAPPFSIDAEGKNDVAKWPRGTTFPAPVLIQRDEGFEGDIVLEMAAKQGRHRQGIRGPELRIPPTVDRILYPVFLPEWLETTRTSRMVVNGVARVADPQGRVRYLSSKLKTRIGFLPTGALLKIDCDVPEIEVVTDQAFTIPLTINRAKSLVEPAAIEIVGDNQTANLFIAERTVVDASQANVKLAVQPLIASDFVGEHVVTIRASALRNSLYPVVSETTVIVTFAK